MIVFLIHFSAYIFTCSYGHISSTYRLHWASIFMTAKIAPLWKWPSVFTLELYNWKWKYPLFFWDEIMRRKIWYMDFLLVNLSCDTWSKSSKHRVPRVYTYSLFLTSRYLRKQRSMSTTMANVSVSNMFTYSPSFHFVVFQSFST
jgi:hypothetical protein